jgi:hypothetical protein
MLLKTAERLSNVRVLGEPTIYEVMLREGQVVRRRDGS